MVREENLTTAIVTPTSHLLTYAATSAFSGGTLWLLYYAIWIVNGLITGQAPVFGVGALSLVLNILFVVGLCAISLNLGLLALVMRPRHPVSAGIALVIAGIAFAGPLYGFFANVLAGRIIGGFGGMGVIGSCLAAALLGGAALRSGQVPRRAAALLLALGLATFPLVIMLGMVANLWFPAWVTDELPFAIAGLGWIVFARLVGRSAH